MPINTQHFEHSRRITHNRIRLIDKHIRIAVGNFAFFNRYYLYYFVLLHFKLRGLVVHSRVTDRAVGVCRPPPEASKWLKLHDEVFRLQSHYRH